MVASPQIIMTTQILEKNGIDLEKIKSEEEDLEIDSAKYEINTYGADFTLELLSKKIDENEIIVPEFQRRYVWPIKKASKLIESFLLGLPVPQIFLYRDKDSQELLVVDGQQRLKTTNFFIKGIFNSTTVFKLTGVKERWEGKTYNDLELADKRKFNNYILRANIFEQTNPKDNSSIFEIFERLNTGGIALNQQEIRNCVIRGNIGEFLNELNKNDGWRNIILRKKQPDERMKDIEMIVRFWALFERIEEYRKPMKDFITSFMRDKENLEESDKEKFKKIFVNCVELIVKEIPKKPFRLKAGINIAIFDSVMVAMASVGPENIQGLNEKYDLLLKDKDYLKNVSEHTTDGELVKNRITTAIRYFSNEIK